MTAGTPQSVALQDGGAARTGWHHIGCIQLKLKKKDNCGDGWDKTKMQKLLWGGGGDDTLTALVDTRSSDATDSSLHLVSWHGDL